MLISLLKRPVAMRGMFVSLMGLACAVLTPAESLKLGIYLQGSRIGETAFVSQDDTYEGKVVKRGDMTTTMDTGMLGAALKIEMKSTSWFDSAGKPLRMKYSTSSSGRTQTLDATFGATHVDMILSSGGSTQTKRVAIPTDGPVVEDPLPMVLEGGANTTSTVYVLRPDTASFAKTTVANRGASTTTMGGQEIAATLIEMKDPMTTMRVYVSSKGDLIKAEGPFGIEMIPEGMPVPQPGNGIPDLANASSIKTDKPIANPRFLRRLTIKVAGSGLPTAIPSGDHQTAKAEAGSWIIDIHPPRNEVTPGLTIEESGDEEPEWLKSDSYVPADSEEFKLLAKEVIGDTKRVRDAALKVQKWIRERMRPNAGIGVLRDASEILATKEGVCRDSAILAATILRAGGIPTKLASGLVNWNGSFFYHAWVEVWDGRRWLGIDPTVFDPQLSASHVKLAEGSVEDAFRFPVLDKVSITVERVEGD